MNIVQFSPFGLASEETGLLSLFSNFLTSQGHSLRLLRCNGLFTLCDRDGESNWRRNVSSCLACMAEQKSVATWAGIKVIDLSPFISPDEILSSKRWLLSCSGNDIFDATFEDAPIWELCRRSFSARFGTDRADLKNRHQEQSLHRFLVSAARAYTAARNFLRTEKPELVLLASGEDYLSAAMVRACEDTGHAGAVFRWDMHERSITIKQLGSDRDYHCPIVFEDVTSMRPDPRTWPWELIQIMEQLAAFLGIASSQLELPISKVL